MAKLEEAVVLTSVALVQKRCALAFCLGFQPITEKPGRAGVEPLKPSFQRRTYIVTSVPINVGFPLLIIHLLLTGAKVGISLRHSLVLRAIWTCFPKPKREMPRRGREEPRGERRDGKPLKALSPIPLTEITSDHSQSDGKDKKP